MASCCWERDGSRGFDYRSWRVPGHTLMVVECKDARLPGALACTLNIPWCLISFTTAAPFITRCPVSGRYRPAQQFSDLSHNYATNNITFVFDIAYWYVKINRKCQKLTEKCQPCSIFQFSLHMLTLGPVRVISNIKILNIKLWIVWGSAIKLPARLFYFSRNDTGKFT